MQLIPSPQSLILQFPKEHRLRTPADFARVYKSKQWGVSDHHSYNVVHQRGVQALGVTVSKKVAKSAVVRNRLKREIREFYRLRRDQLPNTEIVITAKPSSASVTREARQQSLSDLWVKVGRWRHWQNKQDGSAAKS